MGLKDKLGSSYSNVKEKIKFRKIIIKYDDYEFDLTVRIPLKHEMEDLIADISLPNETRAKELFEKYANPIRKSVEEGGEDFLSVVNKEKEYIVINDDDIILDGNSVKQVANLTSMWEKKVVRYFHLLKSETDVPIDETFEQIVEEFSEPIVKLIVDERDKAIKPDYNTVKKN